METPKKHKRVKSERNLDDSVNTNSSDQMGSPKKHKKKKSGKTLDDSINTQTSDQVHETVSDSSFTKSKKKKRKSSCSESHEGELESSPSKKQKGESVHSPVKRLKEVSNGNVESMNNPKLLGSPNKGDSNKSAGSRRERAKVIIPKAVSKLQDKYLAANPDGHGPVVMDAKSRQTLQSNWNDIFSELEHPNPALLFHPGASEKEEADSYIKEHKIYKKLFKNIDKSPVCIYKALLKSTRTGNLKDSLKTIFPKDKEGRKLVKPLLKERFKGSASHVGGTYFADGSSDALTQNEIQLSVIILRRLCQGNVYNVLSTEYRGKRLWSKLDKAMPGRAGKCRSSWVSIIQWCINSNFEDCQAFTLQERIQLFNRVADLKCDEQLVEWSSFEDDFPNRSAEDLKYYWYCLKSLVKHENSTEAYVNSLRETVRKMDVASKRITKASSSLKEQLERHKKLKAGLQERIAQLEKRVVVEQHAIAKCQTRLRRFGTEVHIEEEEEEMEKEEPAIDTNEGGDLFS